jgi:osmotically inducible protein OsmC
MADIQRTGSAIWQGDLRRGEGHLSSGSGVLLNQMYSFRTRFEQSPGTNPEELIAAAHAACYSMALAHLLSTQNHRPESIETRAVCTLSPQSGGGFKITEMRLAVTGRVPGIDEATFKRIAQEAEKGCPVSNALRGGLRIELEASLEQPAAG